MCKKSGPQFEFKAKTSRYTKNKVLFSVPCTYAREPVIEVADYAPGTSRRALAWPPETTAGYAAELLDSGLRPCASHPGPL